MKSKRAIYTFARSGLIAASVWLAAICLAGPVVSQESHAIAAPNATVTTMVLSISPDQVVGYPFQKTATILLLDSANNLVTDYDLAANPITLTVGSGLITPAILSDPALMTGGVINFLPALCTYTGVTGKIPVTATNGAISSEPVIVSFSGYDILEVTDFKGDSIIEVYQGLPTTVKVRVCNKGGLTAISNPSVRSYFKAGGGSVQVFFAGHKDGTIDTVTMIDTAFIPVIVDTLIVQLDARYQIGTSEFLTADTVRLPVFVRTPASVSFVTGSVAPDSVYAGEDFPLGFRIQTTGFAGLIDSSRVKLELAPNQVDPVVARVFSGSPAYADFTAGVITYSGLAAKVVPLNGFSPGWYVVRAEYHLFSGASEFKLNAVHPDTLYVIPRSGPEYVASSFDPDTVAAGAEAAFQFRLTFGDGANLEVEPGSATFTILGSGFAATVNLMIPNGIIASGENLITTENVFIPANQLGHALTVSAELRYRRFGSPTYLAFATTFNDQLVQVQEFPVVQIVAVDCEAPNGNKVNTNQPFRIHARIANVSESQTGELVFRLTSDGTTIDSVLQSVPLIAPLSTYDLYFDLTASATANSAEIFSVNFVSGNAGRLPPVDNIALVSVQTPATLVLSYDTAGADGGFVTQGSTFSLAVSVTNLGLASVSPGLYHLSTEGIDFGLVEEDTIGEIAVESPRNISFRAPFLDTSVTVTFTITQKPLDLNTGNAAVFQDSSFSFDITVASTDARLVVNSEQVLDRPLTGGVAAELFALHLENSSGSQANLMQLDSVALRFADRSGHAVDVERAIDLDTSGLSDGIAIISSGRSAADSLVLTLSYDTITAGEQQILHFIASALDNSDGNLAVQLDSAGVFASFIDGPSAGSRVPLVLPNAGQPIVNLVCATAGRTLEQSFMVENNPWHQETEPARFAYILETNSPLEFRIFTLTGELVHSVLIDSDSPFGQTGSHVIEWDGRNERGKIVLDGVYIVQLQNMRSGERARLKLAVLK